MTARQWVWKAAGLAVIAGATAWLASGPSRAATPWGADYFPNAVLTTQDGKTVRFYDDLIKGKSVAINLFYTSCQDICPLETAKLVQLQKLFGARMGKDIFFYSIAIDPWDTPKENKAYAQKFGVGPGWLFLSGKEADIQLISRKLGLSRASDAVSKDGHSASLMVGNVGSGLWMRNSAMDNPQFLATTIGNFLGWRDPKADRSYAEARPLDLDKGQFLFQSRCAACHTIGAGDRLGPDLMGVTSRRQRGWLARYLAQPEQMLAEGDPVATSLFKKYRQVRMPNLELGTDDVASLLSYLEARSHANGEPPAGKEAGKEAAAVR
ncbi:SCO family protein [Polaromonas sp.]|uniref:SCO family protein n=1 Tax=Polaromonas sp. TaxID=1869339 RepID=UPI00286C1302|nr:SCO family protein [Polaromonas sp.]